MHSAQMLRLCYYFAVSFQLLFHCAAELDTLKCLLDVMRPFNVFCDHQLSVCGLYLGSRGLSSILEQSKKVEILGLKVT